MRKQIIKFRPVAAASIFDRLDIESIATVLVTSGLAGHSVENVFNAQRGRGGSGWISETGGEQAVKLAFDTPQTIRSVSLEIEETKTNRTQKLQLSAFSDEEKTYQELRRQEFHFAPADATFKRKDWTINGEGVTHLWLQFKPDKSGEPSRASLASLGLR